jgi:hypothetical protein
MMYESYSYEGGKLVSYKSVWHVSDGELDDEMEDVDLDHEFPFADLYNSELETEYPTNYKESDDHIFYKGVWYPVDSAYETEERWWPHFELDGEWLPYPEEGSSVFFVDETETIPFAEVSNEELLSLYSDHDPLEHDPLDYEDPYPEVYDMEYLE